MTAKKQRNRFTEQKNHGCIFNSSFRWQSRRLLLDALPVIDKKNGWFACCNTNGLASAINSLPH